MTQSVDSLIQPRFLYGDRTPTEDSDVTLTEAYPSVPNSDSTTPNVCLVFGVENQVWWRTDRAAPAGTMRDKQNQNQRPLIEEPFKQDKNSQGLIKDCGASATYQGNTIYSRIETVEEEGNDPIRTKVPRRSYVTGISHDGTANLVVGVTMDEYQTATLDSGNVKVNKGLEPDVVWWGGNAQIEGTRIGHTIIHSGSEQIVIESYVSEHRTRSRR